MALTMPVTVTTSEGATTSQRSAVSSASSVLQNATLRGTLNSRCTTLMCPSQNVASYLNKVDSQDLNNGLVMYSDHVKIMNMCPIAKRSFILITIPIMDLCGERVMAHDVI